MSKSLQPCGTLAAYTRHVKNGETPDDACREANNAYHREYQARNSDQREKRRAKARAYSDALHELRRRHPLEFALILAGEEDGAA